ncbi:uncharacterized protein BP5553_10453 [Venustampulla echinocandica]|uniref:ABC transporter domain-containing protein n=1 Tax=Venustampulla echinocandica TaxID=2656787 RepID=A0A370T9C3_9HELO|nr:uncharacterized protein BP5553_10453 [Venustampulla echinocandica]RDL30175.1 hypothetical protein BP5553_10453 [Venustampulla echinocandica]
MAFSPQRPRLRRIYRQTLILTQKNLLLFYKSPIATIFRALVFPIAVTLLFCYLQDVGSEGSSYSSKVGGISTSTFPVKDLSDAIGSARGKKLVFIRNGIAPDSTDPVIQGILQQPGMESVATDTGDHPDDLFDLCKQSTKGHSDCFAAVVFQASNETTVEYSIVIDGPLADLTDEGDYRTEDSTMANYILPLQWAINSHIGGFSTSPRPSIQPYTWPFARTHTYVAPPSRVGKIWLSIIGVFVAPVFILIPIGVVYHLAVFVATERETSMAELMAAQKVSITPRILSTFISFFALYFPGLLISSILLTQILFTRTPDILLLFLVLLGGASLITSAHFLASFFSKAQLAGLYTSTLVFALSLVTLASSLTSKDIKTQNTALSAIFPPMTWAFLIGDVATKEYNLAPFSLTNSTIQAESMFSGPSEDVDMSGYLYVVFFILQIIVFSLATYAVEHQLWGVSRKFGTIDASSDVAVRCTSLSKTYYGKRRWYWPFSRKGAPTLAVSNLNLEVKKGSVTFLLGPNGGGKTTTLKCVAGMASMDSGSQLELNEAGLVFGICPQHNVFWQNLTVEEHIKIWRKLKTAAFDNTAVDDDDDVLAECDLLEKAKAPAQTLSGGQMRKLQLAIAFVGESKVCCIDEASSGLDPLSRRNIWNIIQKGHSRRTILVTTHFLDEADVLADHIAIVYKGKLVCEGPGTSLKSRFGDQYLIRSGDPSDEDNLIWRTSNSAEATRKVLELEALTDDNTFDVVFPTLEQVFLKVTSDSNTAIHENGGDGIVGEEQTSTVLDEKILALEQERARDMDLEVGHSIGLARQVFTLFQKRYILLQQKAGWISYGINLIIPIIIAAAFAKFVHKWGAMQTCQTNVEIFHNAAKEQLSMNPYYNRMPLMAPLSGATLTTLHSFDKYPIALVGPLSEFSGPGQDELLTTTIGRYIVMNNTGTLLNKTAQAKAALAGREFVDTAEKMVSQISDTYASFGISVAIFAPAPEKAILFYSTARSYQTLTKNSIGFNLITNRIANATTKAGTAREVVTTIRTMRHPQNEVDFRNMPLTTLIVLSFIAAASIAVIYPAFEKINRVRALHYCNGVLPVALWLGYLLFDIQIILIQSIVVWALLFAGSAAKVWYASNYLFGAFILFGIATYLGTYLLSLYTRKAAFAIAAGIHILLFVLYLVSYVMVESFGDEFVLHETYSQLQYGLGLTSPGANLARALYVASNSFEILCGKYADASGHPFAYVRYGSVYANLLIQIIFLIIVLAIHEYGSGEWIRRNITHRGIPARLHYIVEAGAAENQATGPVATGEKNATAAANQSEILQVSQLSKFFGKLFAVENVSFDIGSNETLALLGGNGAGKTTCINMIRGELTPNFGTIHLEGVSVLKEPYKARLRMGVCPQDDAIDNLTVRQTLHFYAKVKGLKNAADNVDKVLEALNISTFQDKSVKDLSGGTRRKLSVAIALLGNPRVLLLDEPSTGQDAGAKRILWKALQDVSTNRAILLTTHSMEEAEALATKVAIMGTKMLATGTLSSLQETHGGAYSIRAIRAKHTTATEVEEIVKGKFEGRVSNYVDGYGQISFNLPHDKAALGAIMKVMEGLKGDVISEGEDGVGGSAGGDRVHVKYVEDYTITGPTLEEVFMNVARESGTA